jgi:general stress protein YciG
MRAMPKGPQGQKRPADAIGTAIKVARILTGEEQEDQPKPKSAAAELGAKGGAARAKKLTKEHRAEIARKGAAKRWGRSIKS